MKKINTREIIKEYFLQNPTKRLRVREIERELNLSLPSVILSVKKLVEEELLQIIKISSVVFYSANRSNENYILEKKLFNLRQIYDSGLIDEIKYNLFISNVYVFTKINNTK